eukprot:g29568.t1
MSLAWSLCRTTLLFATLPSSVIEAGEFCLFIWVLHAFLVLAFGVFVDVLWIGVIMIFFLLILAKATSFSTILLAGMLFFSFLDTVAKVLLFLSRRWRKLPGRGRPVTAKNVKVGMKVLPGKDWMYDMKKDDAKQNAAPGCSMVGTVTNCDDCQDWSPVASISGVFVEPLHLSQELGYCEVMWVNGSEGRYRITTSWQTASDLRRHPDWYAVCVEATVLLFGPSIHHIWQTETAETFGWMSWSLRWFWLLPYLAFGEPTCDAKEGSCEEVAMVQRQIREHTAGGQRGLSPSPPYPQKEKDSTWLIETTARAAWAQDIQRGALPAPTATVMPTAVPPAASLCQGASTVQYGVNDKYYLMKSDTTDYANPANFEMVKLAGKTMVTTIDLHGR